MIRTRFAPSPTGYLHVGGARTALFCYLFARHHQGEFVLRIEDTDRQRSSEESVQAILDGMQWLGLEYDQGPYYQTERFDRYRAVVQSLLDDGHAYYCYCSPKQLETMREEQKAAGLNPRYDGRYRDFDGQPPPGVDPVVRFKNPLLGSVSWCDLVKGQIEIDNAQLDDQENITLRSDSRLDNGVTNPITGASVSANSTQWFLAAGPNRTIEVGFLQGMNRRPVIREYMLQQGRWGIGFDVSHDIGAKALSHLGLYKAVGTA